LRIDRPAVRAAGFLLAQKADAQLKTHPAIENKLPNYSYSTPLRSLREFDPRNGEVIVFGGDGLADLHAKLRAGRYEKHHKVGGDALDFEWLRYINGDSGNANFAVAYYTMTSWAGSSSNFGVVQLLSLDDGHLHVVQQLVFNTRGSKKAGAHFGARSQVLTILGVNDWEHCCPTGLDVVRFRLKDGVFKQVGYGTAALQ
jgi:hypothetical protein